MISPLLESHLGVRPNVIENFDTDKFGTFSGEIARTESPLDTLRRKLYSALCLSGETLAIASEGSFGTHPKSPFIPVDEEFVMLIDTANGLEVIGYELTEETNFHSCIVHDWKSLHDFTVTIGFPDHGIILKTHEGEVIKGILDVDMLKGITEESLGRGAPFTVETDMRALYNPTRMTVIGKATENLIATIFRPCPKCSAPGFRIAKRIRGLLCQLCQQPTRLTKSYLFECQKCLYTEMRKIPSETKYADPQYCDFCNP